MLKYKRHVVLVNYGYSIFFPCWSPTEESYKWQLRSTRISVTIILMLESLSTWSLMKYVWCSVLMSSEPGKYLLLSISSFCSFPIFHCNFSYLWSSLSVTIHFQKRMCDLNYDLLVLLFILFVNQWSFGLQIHWQIFLISIKLT